MIKAMYTLNRGMVYIMDFMELPPALACGWLFMVILLSTNWLRPARMGMRITPMTAQVNVKFFTSVQGVSARSIPMNL